MRKLVGLMLVFCGCVSIGLAALAPMPELLDRAAMIEATKSATSKDYPNSDTVSVGQAGYVQYAADGTYTEWEETYLKALTEKGAKSLREVPSGYQEGFSESGFLVAEVLRADGTVVPIDIEKQTATATSNRNTSDNIYDPTQRKIVLTVPELNVGDALHFIVADRNFRVRIPDSFMTMRFFEDTDPIPYSTYTIVAPKALPLRLTALLDEIPNTVTASTETLPDGQIRYRWVAKAVPQLFMEANMPEVMTQIQRVAVSTFGSWEEVSQWYWALCASHLKMTPEMDAKVAELTAGCVDDDARMTALFRFVSQEIRYMGIIAEKTAPGYEPHDVSMTFENRYGVCRDKGVLLVAMLRKAGFDAYPVLINAGAKFAPEVPIPYFNHAIVAIDRGGRDYTLLDPTDETTRDLFPAYLSDCSYLVARPEGDRLKLTATPDPEANLMEIVTDGSLDDAGVLTLQATLKFGGINDNAYRSAFIGNPPERLLRIFDGLVKRAVSGAELFALEVSPKDAQDITQPLVVKLSIRVPAYAVPDANGRTLIRLPFLSRTFGFVNFQFDGLDQPERKYDWQIVAPAMVRETLTLKEFARLGQPSLLPENPTLKTAGAAFELTTKCEGDQTYVFTRSLELSQKSYTPEEYLNLRSFTEKLARLETVRPLFTKPMTQDADAIVQERSDEVLLLSPYSTVTRHKEAVRILSYKGKKDNGEVKISTMPASQTLTLTAAEVIKQDGSRVAVSEKEVSVLDSEATASAPRYPASQQTVISLPAVEVGTVTQVDYQITSTHAAPFSERVTFGDVYPIEKQQYSVRVPLASASEIRVEERNFAGADVTSSVTTNAEMVLYCWTARNLSAVRSESMEPSRALFLPTVSITSVAADPQTVTADLVARAERVIKSAPESAAKARELTANCTTDEAKLRAIQAFLATRIRTLGPAWYELPWGTQTAPDVTLREGYANRLDRLLLQWAMLRAVGIQSELVFANYQNVQEEAVIDARVGERVPCYTAWVRPYIRLSRAPFEGHLVGDEGPYDEPTMTLLDGVHRVMTATGETEWNASTVAEETLQMVILENGDAILTRKEYCYGLAAGSLRKWVVDRTPEELKRTIAQLADGLAIGATPYSEYQIDSAAYPVTARLSVYAKNYASIADGMLSIPLPLGSTPFGLRGSTRHNPLWIPSRARSTHRVEVWLPKGVTVRMAPEPFELRLPGGGFIRVSCTREMNPVTGIEHLTFLQESKFLPSISDAYLFSALQEVDRTLSSLTRRTLIAEFPKGAVK
ncbi:MAG: DUF3857 domain-containing protein [Kiritimatiellia bacterium]